MEPETGTLNPEPQTQRIPGMENQKPYTLRLSARSREGCALPEAPCVGLGVARAWVEVKSPGARNKFKLLTPYPE